MRPRCGIAKMQDKFDGTYVMDGWALLVPLACQHLEIQEDILSYTIHDNHMASG